MFGVAVHGRSLANPITGPCFFELIDVPDEFIRTRPHGNARPLVSTSSDNDDDFDTTRPSDFSRHFLPPMAKIERYEYTAWYFLQPSGELTRYDNADSA